MTIFVIRMKFHKNKFLTTIAAAALALAVGACSSSSDDDNTLAATTPTTPTTPTDPTTPAPAAPEDALAAAQAVYDALTAESTDEERTAAETALEDALMLEGNEAAYIAYLEKQVADQEAAAAATAAAAEAEKASDMAKAVLTAIGANTALVSQPAAPTVSLAASSAGELTAKQEGYTMSAAPEEIVGWRGRTLQKDGDTTVIYTNIEDEVPTSLDDLYARASGLPKAAQTYSVTDDGTGSTIDWSDAERADMSQIVTDGTPNDTTTFAGSVRGVDGTFSCTEANCTAPTVQTDGSLDGDVGTWTFAPTDPGAMIQVKDTAYVSFGWWLNAMGTQGAYEFDAFASATGMEAITNRAADDVSGTATYRGAAAGKYAMQSTTEDSASGGHFTAAATLTADFDANTADAGQDANELGVSIGGTITDFMTGETSRPNWKVTLTTPVATEVAPITGTEAVATWSTGGAVDGVGTWSANFYGAEEDTMQPTAATGEFNAAIGGGDIAQISGAFAATKQ